MFLITAHFQRNKFLLTQKLLREIYKIFHFNHDTLSAKKVYLNCLHSRLEKFKESIYFSRYCLFGLNVALTEKFESNSQPMKIHISEPCQKLLTPQYKTVERTDNPELASKVHSLILILKACICYSPILAGMNVVKIVQAQLVP